MRTEYSFPVLSESVHVQAVYSKLSDRRVWYRRHYGTRQSTSGDLVSFFLVPLQVTSDVSLLTTEGTLCHIHRMRMSMDVESSLGCIVASSESLQGKFIRRRQRNTVPRRAEKSTAGGNPRLAELVEGRDLPELCFHENISARPTNTQLIAHSLSQSGENWNCSTLQTPWAIEESISTAMLKVNGSFGNP